MSVELKAHLIAETPRSVGARRVHGVFGDGMNGITHAIRRSLDRAAHIMAMQPSSEAPWTIDAGNRSIGAA